MRNTLLLILLAVVLGGVSCKIDRTADTEFEGTDITVDANLLRLVDCGDFLYAEVRANPEDSVALATYAIVDSGVEPKNIPEGCVVIKAPLQRSVVSSSVHTAGINELGMLSGVAGVADVSYYPAGDPVLDAVNEGKIKNIGSSLAPDIEKIIDLNADGIVVTPFEGEGYNELKKIGVPMILMTDYLESTPLGRAEWLVFIGAIYGKFDEALRIYQQVSEKYQRLRVCANKSDEEPLIITEKPISGVWYVPGGGSYMATMISDAGATYPWVKTKECGSIPQDVSSVIDAADEAEYWLIKDAKDIDSKSLLAEVSHAKAFRAFPNNVYVCNTVDKPYFNAVAFHPELILSDMVNIFHTNECGGDSVLHFFRPLE